MWATNEVIIIKRKRNPPPLALGRPETEIDSERHCTIRLDSDKLHKPKVCDESA